MCCEVYCWPFCLSLCQYQKLNKAGATWKLSREARSLTDWMKQEERNAERLDDADKKARRRLLRMTTAAMPED
ncbi:hypothetical protein KIF59_00835 [Enterobacter cloacae subsp. cloacae]|nr:hypothetical protein [Enterobacter cloacae subsp. cloacae]